MRKWEMDGITITRSPTALSQHFEIEENYQIWDRNKDFNIPKWIKDNIPEKPKYEFCDWELTLSPPNVKMKYLDNDANDDDDDKLNTPPIIATS